MSDELINIAGHAIVGESIAEVAELWTESGAKIADISPAWRPS